MKVSCNLSKLSAAVQTVERLVGKKESLPVLSCVLLEIKKNTLTIKATNLETGVEVSIPGENASEGVVAVPVAIFLQTLRTISDEKVSLETDESGGSLHITTAHSNTLIKVVPHDEFPSIPKENNTEHKYEIPKQVLIEGIRAVSYSASTSLIRPELASIFISHSNRNLVFAATDSFRLAEKVLQTNIEKEFPDVLLPVKNAHDLLSILEYVDSELIECYFDESQISIHGGNAYFFSRIVDATFPQYQAIIPKEFVTEATILKEDFHTLIKKARIFSHTSQQISFHVHPKQKEFSTTARNVDIGETSDSIDAALSGEDLDINLNISYLIDCLQSIRSDSVSLQFGGAGKPLVIKGIGDSSFLYLVMPLNR